jgi:hypothetical protein
MMKSPTSGRRSRNKEEEMEKEPSKEDPLRCHHWEKSESAKKAFDNPLSLSRIPLSLSLESWVGN